MRLERGGIPFGSMIKTELAGIEVAGSKVATAGRVCPGAAGNVFSAERENQIPMFFLGGGAQRTVTVMVT